MKRQKWSEEENAVLRQAVESRPDKTIHWDVVAEALRRASFSKTSKQCRERWLNHLAPALVKSEWTAEENARLLALHQRFENRWKKMAKSFRGRTDNAIKNQFFSLVRKGLRKAAKAISRTSNTAAINKIKPKVLSRALTQVAELPPALASKLPKGDNWVTRGHLNFLGFVSHFALEESEKEELTVPESKVVEWVLDWLSDLK